jgi:hypothetical protein
MSKCKECGDEARIMLLDEYLDDLGCEVNCEGCKTLICLECGQDVANEEEVNA